MGGIGGSLPSVNPHTSSKSSMSNVSKYSAKRREKEKDYYRKQKKKYKQYKYGSGSSKYGSNYGGSKKPGGLTQSNLSAYKKSSASFLNTTSIGTLGSHRSKHG